jgi:hypothetical protein
MITATFKIRGIAPYRQSRPHLEEQEPNEGHDDYRRRTWRAHLHVDKEGNVYIPQGASRTASRRRRSFCPFRFRGEANQLTQKISRLAPPAFGRLNSVFMRLMLKAKRYFYRPMVSAALANEFGKHTPFCRSGAALLRSLFSTKPFCRPVGQRAMRYCKIS